MEMCIKAIGPKIRLKGEEISSGDMEGVMMVNGWPICDMGRGEARKMEKFLRGSGEMIRKKGEE
jgi:hypothetical protein